MSENACVSHPWRGRRIAASDLLIAPHHGSGSSSTVEFIDAVRVFAAGEGYEHPRREAVLRYLEGGVYAGNLFRTDCGDRVEGGPEWHSRLEACNAESDHVVIDICRDGRPEVKYASLSIEG